MAQGDNYNNHDWCFWYCNKRIIKGPGGRNGWSTSGYHPNYSNIEDDQNTEKSLGNMRKLAGTEAPVNGHQLKLM